MENAVSQSQLTSRKPPGRVGGLDRDAIMLRLPIVAQEISLAVSACVSPLNSVRGRGVIGFHGTGDTDGIVSSADPTPVRVSGLQAMSPRKYCQTPCSRQIICNCRYGKCSTKQ